jgi:hypothetical protein
MLESSVGSFSEVNSPISFVAMEEIKEKIKNSMKLWTTST